MPSAWVFPVYRLMILFVGPLLMWGSGGGALGQEAPEKGGVAVVPPVIRLAPVAGATESPVVTALAIDPSGAYAAAAGDDHMIRIFSLSDILAPFPQSALLDGHRDWVQGIEFSADGKLLATCAKDP